MAHKHAELIKAWADGAVIEGSATGNGEWREVRNPTWLVGKQYRVKPEPKTAPPGVPVDSWQGLAKVQGERIRFLEGLANKNENELARLREFVALQEKAEAARRLKNNALIGDIETLVEQLL